MLKALLLTTTFAVSTIAASAAAQTTPPPRNTAISSITVFGDSLVDAGNINALDPTRASAAQGYFDGRFTNGYNYTDYLSLALFGTPTAASLEGGTSFAYGGARATTTSAVPDLTEQLALYRSFLATGKSVDPTGLFVLNFGGNDIFAAVAPGAPAGFASDDAFLQNAAQNLAGAVQSLNDLGARNILVTGFPNATGAARPFSNTAEIALLSELGKLNLAGGTNLLTFSYLDFFDRLGSDPTQFGLPSNLNLTTTCQAARATPDCTGFFSFDGVHPTTAVQRAVFQDIQRQFGFSAAVPEPSTWMMLILGFAFIGGTMRRRTRTTVSYA
jgi:outer membrane lipase/esterase